jgi:hypothetical protein
MSKKTPEQKLQYYKEKSYCAKQYMHVRLNDPQTSKEALDSIDWQTVWNRVIDTMVEHAYMDVEADVGVLTPGLTSYQIAQYLSPSQQRDGYSSVTDAMVKAKILKRCGERVHKHSGKTAQVFVLDLSDELPTEIPFSRKDERIQFGKSLSAELREEFVSLWPSYRD